MVVGNDYQVRDLFLTNGFSVLHDNNPNKRTPDLICFTGGADVSPNLYQEHALRGTSINYTRDLKEVGLFDQYKDIPKVGICRGGQLLNVLSGGAMWQHVDNHTKNHELLDLMSMKSFNVTSTHHQMMIPGEKGVVLGIAKEKLTTILLSAKGREKPDYDTEVVWYENTKSICFQPHPEYGSCPECKNYFFKLINHFFEL